MAGIKELSIELRWGMRAARIGATKFAIVDASDGDKPRLRQTVAMDSFIELGVGLKPGGLEFAVVVLGFEIVAGCCGSGSGRSTFSSTLLLFDDLDLALRSEVAVVRCLIIFAHGLIKVGLYCCARR